MPWGPAAAGRFRGQAMTTTPIVTVTLNPALDLATHADRIVPGPKLRCAEPRADPGGGGNNVSRVIATLGGQSTAFVALGGAAGARLKALIDGAGYSLVSYPAPGETRESWSITDRLTGAQFRFVLPGPRWRRGDVAAVLEAIRRAVPKGALVVMSGSLGPGLPDDLPLRLARRLARIGARMVLDTSGDALRRAAAATGCPVEVLRMDHEEAEDLAGRLLPERADTADFAQSLVRSGACRIAVVARGADGSVLAEANRRLHAVAAPVPVKSKIGAGDSFVGGFALALAEGRPLPIALQQGMAAASATVTTEATRLCSRSLVRRLMPRCPVTAI